ncbi:hypothetical protein Agabi119p4_7346 [Agaricus bisporus var. burnettii]|uniref:Uncharacterized protein n=1 Tax=Agaricus bisporus var. burnettii TaxID=192524 RepID=A0A8H7C7X1_AGABI|nr:hypothetical protein Agabi119p4_7346 [Agaricus bisporus var. burnettii]
MGCDVTDEIHQIARNPLHRLRIQASAVTSFKVSIGVASEQLRFREKFLKGRSGKSGLTLRDNGRTNKIFHFNQDKRLVPDYESSRKAHKPHIPMFALVPPRIDIVSRLGITYTSNRFILALRPVNHWRVIRF